jgi:hypothetical protein
MWILEFLLAAALTLTAASTSSTNPGYEGQPGNQSGNPGNEGQPGNPGGNPGYEGQPGNQSGN